VSGTLVALQYRARTGKGQLVDVSMQAAVASAAEHAVATYDLTGEIKPRRDMTGPQGQDVFFACKDGWLVGLYGRRWDNLRAWAEEAGAADEDWRDPKWDDPDEREKHAPFINAMVRRLFEAQTMAEVSARAHKYRVAIQPVQRIPDLLADPQLSHRSYWRAVSHDDLGPTFTYPGAPFQSSSGFWQLRRRAPLPGEHTAAILDELTAAQDVGVTAPLPPSPQPSPEPGRGGRTSPSQQHPRSRPQMGVGADGIRPQGEGLPQTAVGTARPLEGVRVLDFSQVVTGPLATRILADHGADVIRVEWGAKAAGDRFSQPRVPGNPSPNVSALRYWFNTSKHSITLNMQQPAARAILHRLVGLADVIVDNFGVDPFPQWGMSYEKLRETRPDLIMARSSVVGRTGPKAGMVGFGYGIGAMSGWNQLMGFPGDRPIGTGPAYPDSTANCHHLLIGILTALEHRRRTGQGQYIDLAQYESTITWLGPAVLDFTVNGRTGEPASNRHPDFAPHGVYAVAGVDRWIAIAVDERSWPAFVSLVGRVGVDLSVPEFVSHASRKEHENALDAVVRDWAAGQDPIELAEQLQATGVAASVAANGKDLFEDPQLAHRGHYFRLDHPEAGQRVWERHPFELRGTPATPGRSPLLGESNDWALGELLGMSEEEIARAYVEGILG
jgi:crotonobetainyl-CoA:carnitine CoA-transferase CaiB-like acyl-CoA transferase